jgi:3'(2'), 5'-bisphosphate nucleotidase
MNLLKVCEILQQVAYQAGEAIMQVFENQQVWNVEFKNDDSPVTAADKIANELICSLLTQFYPDIPIISEENTEISYEKRKLFGYFWLIDPLDGTKEFLSRNSDFSVNIALINKNEVIAGVVFLPVLNQLYIASAGNGAFLYQKNKLVQRLKANNFNFQQTNLKVARSRSQHNLPTQKIIAQLFNPQEFIIGASLKFLKVADGNLDFYPRLESKMNEWDVAANQIIVEEAGGQVFDLHTQQKMLYNKPNLKVNSFLVLGQVENANFKQFLLSL